MDQTSTGTRKKLGEAAMFKDVREKTVTRNPVFYRRIILGNVSPANPNMIYSQIATTQNV